MALPTVGSFHMTACDESLGSLERTKAWRGAVSRIERDLFVVGRHGECWNGGKGINERPVALSAQKRHKLRVYSNFLKNRMDDQCFCSRIASVFCWLIARTTPKHRAMNTMHTMATNLPDHVRSGGSPYKGGGNSSSWETTRPV